jgi:signal transduction histidine kinase
VALYRGLAFALAVLAEATDGTVPCTFRHQGKVWVPAAEQVHLYRIAQESLANAVKHAESKRIDMRLISTSKSIVLTVSDDGKGFDPRRRLGMGLQNLRARAEALEAELMVRSKIGKGTRITCTLQRKRGG